MKKILVILGIAGIAVGISGWNFRFFSPGALSSPHARSTDDSVDGCAKCHEPYHGLSRNKCLECHKEIATRIDEKKGFHGHTAQAQARPCQACHHEHRGTANTLVEWPGGLEHFNHDLTGYVLKDKHRTLSCDTCHKDSRIADAAIIALRKEHPGRKTYLGLSTDCAFCHTH